MKKLLLILLCLPMIGFGQKTYVPDGNFEAHLESNGMGDGILNDSVLTANIINVTYLNLNNQSIDDLTGIEDFLNLEYFECWGNNLLNGGDGYGELDLSNNTKLINIDVNYTNLTSLNVNNLSLLQSLSCSNNWLTSLNLSDNTLLHSLSSDNNLLNELDLSLNINLGGLLLGHNPQLTYLDLRNGNNTALSIAIMETPNLHCINVDDVFWATNNFLAINSHHYFSTNCPPPSAIQEHTTNKELLKVTDLLGKETKQTNQPLFYIYDDGTVEKRIVIE